jgi:hypothetical protein
MEKLNRSIALLFACVVSVGHSQTKPAMIQQDSEKSICANVVALTGNVEMKCSNLTPAQKQALADIPNILKMALSNGDYLKAIKKQLEDMAKTVPTVTNVAPGGFAVSGGTLVNPQVTNNLSEPMPHIKGLEILTSGVPISGVPIDKTKYIVSFRFYTDSSWNDPQFGVLCDRPCYAFAMASQEAKIVITPNFRVGTNGNPNVTVFLPRYDRPFPEDEYFVFSVASRDGQPIHVLDVAPIKAEIRPPQ